MYLVQFDERFNHIWLLSDDKNMSLESKSGLMLLSIIYFVMKNLYFLKNMFLINNSFVCDVQQLNK